VNKSKLFYRRRFKRQIWTWSSCPFQSGQDLTCRIPNLPRQCWRHHLVPGTVHWWHFVTSNTLQTWSS